MNLCSSSRGGRIVSMKKIWLQFVLGIIVILMPFTAFPRTLELVILMVAGGVMSLTAYFGLRSAHEPKHVLRKSKARKDEIANKQDQVLPLVVGMDGYKQDEIIGVTRQDEQKNDESTPV